LGYFFAKQGQTGMSDEDVKISRTTTADSLITYHAAGHRIARRENRKMILDSSRSVRSAGNFPGNTRSIWKMPGLEPVANNEYADMRTIHHSSPLLPELAGSSRLKEKELFPSRGNSRMNEKGAGMISWRLGTVRVFVYLAVERLYNGIF
jgi:hypothetical protein